MEPQPLNSSTPPSIPPQPVEEKSPHSNRTFKIALLVFLFLLLAAIVTYTFQNYQPEQEIVVTPTEPTTIPVPTSSEWKTYVSEKYGFEFKYRPDLTIKEREGAIDLVYMGELEPYDKQFSASIYIIDNPHAYSPRSYAEKELCKDAIKLEGQDTTNYCLNLVKEHMEVYKKGEADGIKTQYNLYENPTQVIIFPFNKKLVLVMSSGETGGLPTALASETIDQILNSFQFIEEKETSTSRTKIIDGNAYLIHNGKEELLANKNDFIEDAYAPPIMFTDAVLSSDQRKVLLIAQGGISANLLFYSDLNNVSFKYIHTVSEAVWSKNSRYIAFTSSVGDAGGDYFLGLYDSNSNKTADISKQSTIEGVPSYSNIRWKNDDSAIIVHYSAQDEIPYGNIIGQDDITISVTN